MRISFQCAFIFLATILCTSCFNVRRIDKSVKAKKVYNGWYIGTANAHFFVVKRGGFLKRNLAFMLPEYPANCRFPDIPYSFFLHRNSERIYRKDYLVVGHSDSSFFKERIWLCKARALCSRVDTGYIRNVMGEKQKLVNKIRASDGVNTVKALWVDNFTGFDNLILFSNYNNDSVQYRICDRKTKQTE